ncbi:glycosyltransferase family 2 protein [Halococcus sp. IIIV-5B]|uniref:glycosyltransferase family 2 protein n=1 Tax=Halococcus sp. IIIV-5B TaxID=2321230 RepID=UPI000E733EE3|nr:glycosyltransferase [Halococcus sp. IIIV-5B]RJT06749.1 glycosyltransferase [Halococcus sp. IIIV-5B]
MQLSVVVPTLNARRRLVACLDALAAVAPESEVVVVNGPSADGTTGIVREREDVDVLVEVADRNVNVMRNAGIEHADGDRIAFVGQGRTVAAGWLAALADGFTGDHVHPRNHTFAEGYSLPERSSIGAVTGPTLPTEGPAPETRAIAGREVTYFDGFNVAFSCEALDGLDGFDEYLETGGSRDLAHRLAAAGYDVAWRDGMAVRRGVKAPQRGDPGTPVPHALSDGGQAERDWYWKYRALAYRLVKNYGLRPTTARRLLSHAGSDAAAELRDIVSGEATPSGWAATGRDVITGTARGQAGGVLARWRDRGRRNPRGVSSRSDRAVAVYDRR